MPESDLWFPSVRREGDRPRRALWGRLCTEDAQLLKLRNGSASIRCISLLYISHLLHAHSYPIYMYRCSLFCMKYLVIEKYTSNLGDSLFFQSGHIRCVAIWLLQPRDVTCNTISLVPETALSVLYRITMFNPNNNATRWILLLSTFYV